MKKLMQKIMLTCKKATFFSSIKNFKKLNAVQRFQLMLHLLVCPQCKEFDEQSNAIDKTIQKFSSLNNLKTEEKLSEEKISDIQKTVNQQF
jgi:hypothetical protein